MPFPNQPKKLYPNPWNLTPSQERVMKAYCEYGMYKVAADKLNLTRNTVNSTLRDAHKRMGFRNINICANKYAVWMREQELQVATLQARLDTALLQLELARKELDFQIRRAA